MPDDLDIAVAARLGKPAFSKSATVADLLSIQVCIDPEADLALPATT